MKEQKITMYLTFRFDNQTEDFKNYSGYGVTKSGKAYLKIIKAEERDESYADFDRLVEKFLAACSVERNLIDRLVKNYGGAFNIEVVTEVSASRFPAITVGKNLIDFINSLNGKFNVLDFDTYFI